MARSLHRAELSPDLEELSLNREELAPQAEAISLKPNDRSLESPGSPWTLVDGSTTFLSNTACCVRRTDISVGVARDGIEPPTRGFSVRCSTN